MADLEWVRIPSKQVPLGGVEVRASTIDKIDVDFYKEGDIIAIPKDFNDIDLDNTKKLEFYKAKKRL